MTRPENTQVFRSTQVDAPMYAASLAWFTTKKLGSLLDDAAHLHARKRLAISGLHNVRERSGCAEAAFQKATVCGWTSARCSWSF